MLRQTAVFLGPDLRKQVVFIGGAIAPILQTDPALPKVRPTKDVDAIVASASYTDMQRVEKALRKAGFRQSGMVGGELDRFHAHRWITPGDGAFDLVPAGKHLGATGSTVDEFAWNSSWKVDIGSQESAEVVIRHASPVAFLALKWAAHNDRGRDDPRSSHDLEDIVALVASRPTIATECEEAPEHIQMIIVAGIGEILNDPDVDELIDGHLGLGGAEAEHHRRVVKQRFKLMLRSPDTRK